MMLEGVVIDYTATVMDDDRFACLLEAFARDLNAFKAALDRHVEALHEQSEFIHRDNQPQSSIAVRAALELPVEAREYYSSKARPTRRKRIWRWTRNSLEIAAVVVAIVLASLTYRTLQQVKRQADSAHNQVFIMEEQNRPWLKVTNVSLRQSVPPILTLSFQHYKVKSGEEVTQATLQIEFMLRNIGHSVAQSVMVESELFFTTASSTTQFTDAVKTEQTRFCDASLSGAPDMSARSAVFPDGPSIWDLGVSGTITGDRVIRDPSDPATAYISGVLIGCVNYRFGPIADGDRPQTRVLYHIYDERSRFLQIGKDLTSNRLMIVRDEYGDYAQ